MGAKYFIAPVYSRWMITTDYVARTQTLNLAQSVPTLTVLHVRDRTVRSRGAQLGGHGGIHEGLLNLRWQRLPTTPASVPAAATLTLVKQSALRSALPATTRYVTPDERRAQREERARSHAARFAP